MRASYQCMGATVKVSGLSLAFIHVIETRKGACNCELRVNCNGNLQILSSDFEHIHLEIQNLVYEVREAI